MTKPSVFVSASVEELEAAHELARQLEGAATVTVWSDLGAFGIGQTISESLTEIVDRSDFAVFILAADQPDTRWSSRSNQFFELGYFAGRLGRSRTFVLVPERAR